MNDKSYEDQLGDALEKLLEDGADDLEALSSGLNGLGVLPPDERRWTAERLAAEFKRLGT